MMTLDTQVRDQEIGHASAGAQPDAPDDMALDRAIKNACQRIAPLWPLKHFVAVNPFLGFADRTFGDTAAALRRIAKVDMLMPRAFYAKAIEDGRITDSALQAALDRAALSASMPRTLSALKDAAHAPGVNKANPSNVIATVAEILDGLSGGDQQVSRVGFMIDEISKFCAAYFDEGQAPWHLPAREQGLYAAWRQVAAIDRNPEFMGITGFRQAVAQLPADPTLTIRSVIQALGIPHWAVEDYLNRALIDIGGWASYARYLGWQADLTGTVSHHLGDLLAIRIAWGYGLFAARQDQPFREAWAQAMADGASPPKNHDGQDDPDLAVDLVLHDAYERAFQTRLIADILAQAPNDPHSADSLGRPSVQAAFCIDVRSEIFRRAFEASYPKAETIGFAGFFGFPIEYIPIGRTKGGAQCPVLLNPAFVVCESVRDADPDVEAEVLGLRLLRRRAAKAWKIFKNSAVSSFTYVETAGLLFGPKIISDALGLTRTVADPQYDGLDTDIAARLSPQIGQKIVDGRATGFDPAQRVAMAEAVLTAMSMRSNFARLVMLTGHGSTTVNNPHASGLDCGACGGHTGEANARVAAAILNDPSVRVGLRAKGIHIPDDTWFLGALHDTTTDIVRVFDEDRVPPGHRNDMQQLKTALAAAAQTARMERAGLLGLAPQAAAHGAVEARSRDWSQTRPEWGLAGNAAFIAAPRALTRTKNFSGRAFLHSYEHQHDQDYGVLQLIMTAPVVVASWINLQYFGSTVNNRAFGSGNKVLHNVIGQLGVLEGNGGDLRVGLPMQSVHDGHRFIHEPVRLNVFIAAPEAAMDAVIAKHDGLRHLIDHEWIFLYALSDDGRVIRRRIGAGDWRQA
jgi:uncharacterized protein YbcC (UPF0753/DUF2309 family)